MNCDVVVLSGKQVGSVFELGDRAVVGRAKGADVRLSGGRISLRHCEFRVVDGELRVRDTESTNGISLNGHRVPGEVGLKHGDVLDVGGVSLLVRDHDASAHEGSHDDGESLEEEAPTRRFYVADVPDDDMEIYFALQMVNVLDLGRVLVSTSDARLIVEILEAKVRAALKATRCIHLSVRTGEGAPTFSSTLGAPVTDVRISAALAEELQLKARPTFGLEDEDVMALVAPMPLIVPGEGAGALYVERLASAEPFTTFERGLLAALSIGLEQTLANLDDGSRTRVWNRD